MNPHPSSLLDQSDRDASGTPQWVVLRWLVEPAASVTGREARRRVRLLSSLLFVLTPFTLNGAVSSFIFAPNPIMGSMLAGSTVALILAYSLSRTRYHQVGAAIAVAAYAGTPFLLTVLLPDHSYVALLQSLVWLILPVLLANLLFSIRGFGLTVVAICAGVVLLPLLIQVDEISSVFFLGGFIGVVSGLLSVTTRHRNLIEQDRLFELSSANRELQALRESLEQRVAACTAELAETNIAVQAQKNFLDSIIDNLPLILSVKDIETARYVLWNRAGEEFFGVDRQAVIGKGDREILPTELAERFETEDGIVVATGQPLDIGEETVLNPSKGPRLLRTQKLLMAGLDGKPKYLLGISEDTTERKQTETALRQERNMLRTLMDTLPDSIYFKDVQSHFTHISKGLADRFDLIDPGEAVGRSDFDFYSIEHAQPAFDDEQRILRTGQPIVAKEEKETWPDGRVKWVLTTKMPLRDANGEIVGTFGVSHDITERKLAEDVLHRQKAYLEALHDTALGLLSRLDVTNLLEAIVVRAGQLVGTHHGYIYLLGPDSDQMELKVGVGEFSRDVGLRIRRGTGIGGQVWEAGRPLVVNDYDQWSGRISQYRTGAWQSVIAVPLSSGKQIVGVIGLGHEKVYGRTFGEEEVELLVRFAELASVALDKARVLETERIARQRAETLQAATQTLSATLDVKRVLEIILAKLREVVPYDRASVQEIKHGALEIIDGAGFANWEEARGRKFDATTATPHGEVVSRRRPLILSDITLSPYADARSKAHTPAGFRSWLGVPLLFGDRAIGMIALDKSEPDFYNEGQAGLALAFAAQAAIAINNARMFTAVQDYAAESAALYHASTWLLNPQGDVAGLADQIAEAVTREFALSNCSVLLLNDTNTELIRTANAGDFQAAGASAILLNGLGLTAAAARLGELVYAPDVTADPRYLAKDSRTRSELVVPLKAGERVIGVLDLQSPEPDSFDDRAQRIVTAFAKQAELAIENARLVMNLERAYNVLQEDKEKLLASEKMASLGRLTAGIAHEMNTPLATVRSGLSELGNLVREYMAAINDTEVTPDDHQAIAIDMLRAVQLGDTAAEKAASFVRSIKARTRDERSGERQQFDAISIIKDTLLLLGHALGRGNCAATLECEADTQELFGSPGRLAQVVTNLVTNAIEASEVQGGGPIELRLVRTANGVDLLVTDHGVGIPPEHLPKIFDPLFSTRPFGQGAGLGLTLVHDIVVGEFGGSIEVASQVGEGTTFRLHFHGEANV